MEWLLRGVGSGEGVVDGIVRIRSGTLAQGVWGRKNSCMMFQSEGILLAAEATLSIHAIFALS